MYVRTTTASRRAAQQLLDKARILFVSQGFIRETVEHTDEAGVVSHVTVQRPMFTDILGKKAKGRVYTTGRNYRKRVCRSAHLNHVHMERHHSLRPSTRRTFYPACVGA